MIDRTLLESDMREGIDWELVSGCWVVQDESCFGFCAGQGGQYDKTQIRATAISPPSILNSSNGHGLVD